MTIEHVQRMVERCEAKLRATGDDGSRLYYRLCLAGWRRWVERLQAG